MPNSLVLSPRQRHAFERMAHDFSRIFGPRFESLVASSPHASLAFVSNLDAGDVEAIGALVDTWHHDELDTPLVLTLDEFRRSLDAFPLEYAAVIRRHIVIAGHEPFAGVTVDTAHLRRACEVQAKSHLLHLRQGWIEARGHTRELAELIAGSAEPLRAILANVAHLQGLGTDEPALAGAAAAGLDDALVRDILGLADDPDAALSFVPRLPDYLHAAERLWTYIDRWS